MTPLYVKIGIQAASVPCWRLRRHPARGRDGRLVLWTVMPLGSVANDRLRHMLIGYARVCGRLMHQRPVLEVVRETQAHVPERAGVGQQLPRDGFALIAAQIGNVTTQRIPDERVVTLEGRTVDPATLDTH